MYFVSWSRLDSSAPSSHPSFVGDVFTWNLFEFSSPGLSSQVNVIDISQKNLIKRIWAIGNHEFQVDWLLAPLKWLLKEGGQQVERMISRDRTVLSPDPALQRYDYQSWIKAPLPRQSPATVLHVEAWQSSESVEAQDGWRVFFLEAEAIVTRWCAQGSCCTLRGRGVGDFVESQAAQEVGRWVAEEKSEEWFKLVRADFDSDVRSVSVRWGGPKVGRGDSLTPRLVHSLYLCQGIFTSLSLTGSGFQKRAYSLRSVLALQGASDHPDPREHLVPASDSTRNRL